MLTKCLEEVRIRQQNDRIDRQCYDAFGVESQHLFSILNNAAGRIHSRKFSSRSIGSLLLCHTTCVIHPNVVKFAM